MPVRRSKAQHSRRKQARSKSQSLSKRTERKRRHSRKKRKTKKRMRGGADDAQGGTEAAAAVQMLRNTFPDEKEDHLLLALDVVDGNQDMALDLLRRGEGQEKNETWWGNQRARYRLLLSKQASDKALTLLRTLSKKKTIEPADLKKPIWSWVLQTRQYLGEMMAKLRENTEELDNAVSEKTKEIQESPTTNGRNLKQAIEAVALMPLSKLTRAAKSAALNVLKALSYYITIRKNMAAQEAKAAPEQAEREREAEEERAMKRAEEEAAKREAEEQAARLAAAEEQKRIAAARGEKHSRLG